MGYELEYWQRFGFFLSLLDYFGQDGKFLEIRIHIIHSKVGLKAFGTFGTHPFSVAEVPHLIKRQKHNGFMIATKELSDGQRKN